MRERQKKDKCREKKRDRQTVRVIHVPCVRERESRIEWEKDSVAKEMGRRGRETGRVREREKEGW